MAAKRGRKPKLTVKRVEDALRQTGAIIAAAARMLNVSRTTLYAFLQRHTKIAALALDIEEELKDLAEGKVLQAIRAGDMQTVRWYLEMKAKDRGYDRRVEIVGKDGGPLETRIAPDLSGCTEEELEILLRAAERREAADKANPEGTSRRRRPLPSVSDHN